MDILLELKHPSHHSSLTQMGVLENVHVCVCMS